VTSFVGAEDMVALAKMVCVLVQDGGFIECVGYDWGHYIWNADKTDTLWDVELTADWSGGDAVSTEDHARLDLSMLSTWTSFALGGGQDTLCVFDSTTAGNLQCYGYVAVDDEVTGSLQIESVYCGTSHCCAKSTLTTLVCWGEDGDWNDNGDGGLSELSFDANIVQDYSVAKTSTCALSTDGMLDCFGDDGLDDGPFAISDTFTDVSNVHLAHSGSSDYNFCIYEDATEPRLQCFGENSKGQLGYGDSTARTDPSDLDDVDLLLSDESDSFIAVSGRAGSGGSISESASRADEANSGHGGSASTVWMEALIGIAVLGVVVLLVLLVLKRRRTLGLKAETEMCRAVDIEEPLPNEDDIASTTTTADAVDAEAVDTESCNLNTESV